MSLSTLIAETEELVKDIPAHKEAVDKFVALVPELESAIADLKDIIAGATPQAAAVDTPVASISVAEPVAASSATENDVEDDEIGKARSALDELIASRKAKESGVAAPLPDAS